MVGGHHGVDDLRDPALGERPVDEVPLGGGAVRRGLEERVVDGLDQPLPAGGAVVGHGHVHEVPGAVAAAAHLPTELVQPAVVALDVDPDARRSRERLEVGLGLAPLVGAAPGRHRDGPGGAGRVRARARARGGGSVRGARARSEEPQRGDPENRPPPAARPRTSPSSCRGRRSAHCGGPYPVPGRFDTGSGFGCAFSVLRPAAATVSPLPRDEPRQDTRVGRSPERASAHAAHPLPAGAQAPAFSSRRMSFIVSR